MKNVDNLIELLEAISHSALSSDLIMAVLFSSRLNRDNEAVNRS